METGMSEQELDRVAVMSLRRAGKISQAEAARRLGVSTRQVRRLDARLAKGGEAALRSCSRGKPSNRRTNAQLLARAMNLIREHYQGFGPTLASEYLAERHGIDLSRETLRTFMTHAKLWRPKRGPKARIHALRERRPAFGELIQIDGSFHAWFEARAPSCCLIVFIDDATSALTQLRFVERECTFAYMDALYGHVLEYGVPMALYSDRHGIFKVNTGDSNYGRLSQLGRAVGALGIESIWATSPQAKGRVERANGTLHDRLVKALRVAGIDSIEQANAWLPEFMHQHNRRFAVAPAEPRSAHVPYRGTPLALRRILSKHEDRKLSVNLSCQYRSEILQIELLAPNRALRGATITVVEHFDRSVEVLWKNQSLPFRTSPRPVKPPQYASSKDLAQAAKRRQPPKIQPKANHPWKTTPIAPRNPLWDIRFSR